MKCYLNLVLVTSFLTKQENGNARHDASQKTIKNSTLLHSIGILANQAKATKRTTAACKIENRINSQLIDSQFTKKGGKNGEDIHFGLELTDGIRPFLTMSCDIGEGGKFP